MKFTIFSFVLCIIAATAGQMGIGAMPMGPMPIPFMGYSPEQFFQEIVLQSEAQKLLLTPGFPEDLQQRVLNTMSAAELGFSQCSTTATLPWLRIRCTVQQLQTSKAELKAIDDEAKARAAAATTTTPIATTIQ